jgi:hypothetical protein
MFAYNTAKQASIVVSPFEDVFGRKALFAKRNNALRRRTKPKLGWHI